MIVISQLILEVVIRGAYNCYKVLFIKQCYKIVPYNCSMHEASVILCRCIPYSGKFS